MNDPPKRPGGRSRKTGQARLAGSGAIAQGKRARAVGAKGVLVAGASSAPIHTGEGDIYQLLIQQAQHPWADAESLRRGYLAWVSLRANELPLLAGDSGKPVQLSSVYTALLTEAREHGTADRDAAESRHSVIGRGEGDRQSALEALDRERYLVLMGGPGSGKTTFLNFVALCMAGDLLRDRAINLKLLRTPIPPESEARDAKPKSQPQRWTHGPLLPVRVVLRDFAAALPPAGQPVDADALWNFIVRQLPEQLRPCADHLQADLLTSGGLILLDGLDEVPDALQRREQVKQAVQEFAGIYRECRFLVTSRTYAYQRQDWKLHAFAERELLPFTRGQIERFIETWYVHMASLFRLTAEDAAARTEVLKLATQRAELAELAERPLLLTLMARLQTKGGGSLPEDREKLYAQSVDMLLEEWEGLKLRRDASGQPIVAEPSLGEWLNASRENIRKELDKLAFEAHRDQAELQGTADIRQADLIAALMAASRDRPDTRFTRLEEFLRDRAGLLASHGQGLYQFPHRSFQEYLAACHLSRFRFPDELSRLVKTDPGRWREVALLAAARSRDAPAQIWELVEELCAKDAAPRCDEPEPGGQAQWGALLAAQVLEESGLAVHNPDLQERHERKRLRVRDWQMCLLGSEALPARERALAGNLLDRLGDPRAHLLDVDRMRFVAVPGGPFWMGDQGDSDAPWHLNQGLEQGFWVAETPVTVAQFRQCVEAGGVRLDDSLCLQAPGNRPVVLVTWHQALVFCRWLSERWRDRLPADWVVMLPSEAEWEKAARGGVDLPECPQIANVCDGLPAIAAAGCPNPLPQRLFPWGGDWTLDRANAESVIGEPSTPGCFERGCSPYGCDDMAGNVWEWTRSLWGRDWGKPEFVYPYDPDDQHREDLSAPDEIWRVVRGGSWFNLQLSARCAYRGGNRPVSRHGGLGFRVVVRSSPDS